MIWFIICFVLAVLMVICSELKISGPIMFVMMIVLIVFHSLVTLSLTCRRLHDMGQSGWLQLICLIPYVGGLVIFVMCCIDSQRGTNQYGPNPKGIN